VEETNPGQKIQQPQATLDSMLVLKIAVMVITRFIFSAAIRMMR
jgi:hypothetical protein